GTEFEASASAIMAQNPYNQDFAGRVAFAHARDARSATGDRMEFLGRNRSLRRPAALERRALGNRFGAGLDPCAALHVELALEAGETRQIVFLLGQAEDRDAALEMIRRQGSVAAALDALREVEDSWDRLLGAVQV